MKIYKEIDVRVEMPTKEGLYYTNRGLLEFRDGTFWQHEGRAYVKTNNGIEIWFIEITLPTQEEIESISENCPILKKVVLIPGAAEFGFRTGINYLISKL